MTSLTGILATMATDASELSNSTRMLDSSMSRYLVITSIRSVLSCSIRPGDSVARSWTRTSLNLFFAVSRLEGPSTYRTAAKVHHGSTLALQTI